MSHDGCTLYDVPTASIEGGPRASGDCPDPKSRSGTRSTNAGELADSSASRHDGPTLEDAAGGARAGDRPSTKSAGGARGLLLSWLELTKWVDRETWLTAVRAATKVNDA